MRIFPVARLLAATILAGFLLGVPIQGAVYTLKNGMQIEGMPGKIASLASDPLKPDGGQGESSPKLILFADDGIRRTFFSQYQLRSAVPSPQVNLEKVEI